ncbi:REP-associated tyrosine transposase [Marinomonas sp. IMCC 4694]|uniref:REP-associated tyrosine transposase n=1 Tax=Marinomonas sp. IMCC 4694 TaxID=2605432 RepID=UPI0011E6788D|nr:transposase [Marinomonas sp. IMCC 4694]TYL46858.1 transposase [Marinomonas sp. IMCC 4694]
MPNYVRSKQKGGTFFFTVALQNRQSCLLIDHIDLLRESVRYVKSRRPFTIVAWVVLPDHIHAVWTLPDGDNDFSRRWQLIKTLFTKKLKATTQYKHSIWQKRFWEHEIRTSDDLTAHINYCYLNPVKHGLVASTHEWPYSSFHRDVQRHLFDHNWNSIIPDKNGK